jgi:hypothetical protein
VDGRCRIAGDGDDAPSDDVDGVGAPAGCLAYPDRVFEVVREVVTATGVLRGKARRALDSTILDDAVALQDTVTQLIGAVRRVVSVARYRTRPG